MRSIFAVVFAAIVGCLVGPPVAHVAHAIAAPRLAPPWLGALPFVLLGFAIGIAYSTLRRGRRRGSAFVIMRGRISCPDCEYLLDLDDKHCARCGGAVLQIKRRTQCEKCRGRNWEDDDFCRQCGIALKAEEEPKAEA